MDKNKFEHDFERYMKEKDRFLRKNKTGVLVAGVSLLSVAFLLLCKTAMEKGKCMGCCCCQENCSCGAECNCGPDCSCKVKAHD